MRMRRAFSLTTNDLSFAFVPYNEEYNDITTYFLSYTASHNS